MRGEKTLTIIRWGRGSREDLELLRIMDKRWTELYGTSTPQEVAERAR